MYRTDGITKRIINIVVDDSLRGFINADSDLLKELKRINAKQSMFSNYILQKHTYSFIYCKTKK